MLKQKNWSSYYCDKYGRKRHRYKISGNKDFIEEGIVSSAQEFKQNELKVKDLGGLFIIGTERHESRRIDNQLRGRSGRQGDPDPQYFLLVCKMS